MGGEGGVVRVVIKKREGWKGREGVVMGGRGW